MSFSAPQHAFNPTFPSLLNATAPLRNGTDGGAGPGPDEDEDWSSLIGIITAIVGNILISFALNTQRYAHLRLGREAEEKAQARRAQMKGRRKSARAYADEEDESAPLLASVRRSIDEESECDYDEEAVNAAAGGQSFVAKQKSYLRSWWWWLGIVLMMVGEAGNFLAYGFAPASIVSPLGVVALISNCIIAPILLKEPFRKRDLLGVLVAVAGAVTVVLGAPDNNPKLGPHELWDLFTRWEFETYAGITLVTMAFLMWASKEYGKKSIFIDLGLVGLFGGYTALSTKGVASMLSYTLLHALAFPVTYFMISVLVVTAIMQIKYLNRALMRFDATQVIPTQFVLFTLSVILGSAILYRDFEHTTGRDTGKFVGGCAMTFLGVWFITSGRPRDDEDDNDERAPETEHSIHLEAGEQYSDDEPARTTSRRVSPSMAALTASYPAEHHRRPTLVHLPTPAITLNSDPPSQAVTATTTPAAAEEVSLSTSLTANPWAAESLAEADEEEEESMSHHPPLLHTTASAPILPSEAQILGLDRVQLEAQAVAQQLAERPYTPRAQTAAAAPSGRTDAAVSPSAAGTPRPATPPSTKQRHGYHHSQHHSITHSQPPFGPHHHVPPTTPGRGSKRASISSSKRGSISHSLLPGPLTSPLSASLSGVVADSLRRGVEMRSLAGVAGSSSSIIGSPGGVMRAAEASAPGTPASAVGGGGGGGGAVGVAGGRPRRGTRDSASGFGGWLNSGLSVGFGGAGGAGGSGTGIAGPRDGHANSVLGGEQRRRSAAAEALRGAAAAAAAASQMQAQGGGKGRLRSVSGAAVLGVGPGVNVGVVHEGRGRTVDVRRGSGEIVGGEEERGRGRRRSAGSLHSLRGVIEGGSGSEGEGEGDGEGEGEAK
ncbi:uncharacterized protein K452DRAFT_286696 [Aplosporella prunicola CBS 121167]|uniref:DUF803-domain-containing protein n=1 Tax=Aplosporella prunicola CBS 121167 TaxID=1176127 RepID=A0A6A6BHJ3_9PEZI|nr:uncharacterized protein K452DRAFT_286696 [Aplosporella prunicola CBS 121167]KAF2143068.1 hypothetical protein K452DRAFT_286696 [Aplosporella prunicola CBS 121167]